MKLLARREHTRTQLAAKLRHTQTDGQCLDATLDQLEQLGYLSDTRFAEVFVRSRMDQWGLAKLKHELRQRGVDAELAQVILEQTLVTSEADRALTVLIKVQRVPLQTRSKEMARCQRFLAARGFNATAIQAAFGSHAQALDN